MNKGWISINRKIQSHWLWEEKREFSKLEAWLDILLSVNHAEKKVMIKNTLFLVKRGDSIKALQTWADRWNWNKSKVRRFLELLEKDEMIVTKNETITTRITVCKYDSYQAIENANETQMKRDRNADETQATPNNNDNNVNNYREQSDESQKEDKEEVKEGVNIYSESDFLKNWTACRKHYLNQVTYIKKLNTLEKADFNKAIKEFTKEEINTALHGLFKQENKNISSMYTKPKHFLSDVSKYLNAELNKDYALYGKDQSKSKKGGL